MMKKRSPEISLRKMEIYNRRRERPSSFDVVSSMLKISCDYDRITKALQISPDSSIDEIVNAIKRLKR